MTEVKSKDGSNTNEGIQKYYVTKIEENQVRYGRKGIVEWALFRMFKVACC